MALGRQSRRTEGRGAGENRETRKTCGGGAGAYVRIGHGRHDMGGIALHGGAQVRTIVSHPSWASLYRSMRNLLVICSQPTVERHRRARRTIDREGKD